MATSTTGSTLLQPLSNAVRLPVDQVNFVVCQLFALLAAVWFRTYLHSSKTSPFIRHVVATLLGLYLALFCFGWYALHFVIQSGISYYIMIIIGVENMHNAFGILPVVLCDLEMCFSKQVKTEPSQLSQPSPIGERFQALHYPGGLLDSLQYVHVSLLLRRPELHMVLQVCPYQTVLCVGDVSPPWKFPKVATFCTVGLNETEQGGDKEECKQFSGNHRLKVQLSPNMYEIGSRQYANKSKLKNRYCFVFALGYLTVCQITRVYIFDYGQYSADFSGPMMIITQKITSLAFEIHDGMFRKNEDLTPSQRCLAVRRMPSLLEYLSYNCNFLGILAGPLCSYKDYITFIEGRSYQLQQSEANGKEDTKYEQTDPSPNIAVAQKLLICGLSLLFHMTITKTLPVEYNIDENFRATASWPVRFFYLYVSLMAARPKYYFAWTLADAINNAAGFGFRGYDKNGVTRWDLISNLRIQQIEIRNNIRHYFVESPAVKVCYDIITWMATQIAISYTVVPFVLLSVKPSFTFYSGVDYEESADVSYCDKGVKMLQ
ncbi:hypothetical protein BTVI_121111 [Pitangus sulphuratus]|nr:hypothetical protein BTVI_121111 [Pitangus sulphuratus]